MGALQEALRKCEVLAARNDYRAPWGCKWFEIWAQNIDAAVRQNQQLLVYYFEDHVGHGKVAWTQLSNSDVVSAARLLSGLGASQRAEVATWISCVRDMGR